MKREAFLKQKIKESGYNLKDFAKQIDMPYTTLLSILNKSVGGAALDNIIKICHGLGINIEMLNPHAEIEPRSPITNKYDSLNSLGKQKANDYINDLSENKKYIDVQPTPFEDISDEIKNDVKKHTVTK